MQHYGTLRSYCDVYFCFESQIPLQLSPSMLTMKAGHGQRIPSSMVSSSCSIVAFHSFLHSAQNPITSVFQPFIMFIADPAKSRQSFFRRNQEPLKNYVSSMYEVPVFSAVIWMLPMAGKRGKYWQFNSTLYPYASSTWHSDSWQVKQRERFHFVSYYRSPTHIPMS